MWAGPVITCPALYHFSVALVLQPVVPFGIFVLPEGKAVLSPLLRTNYLEVFTVGGAKSFL